MGFCQCKQNVNWRGSKNRTIYANVIHECPLMLCISWSGNVYKKVLLRLKVWHIQCPLLSEPIFITSNSQFRCTSSKERFVEEPTIAQLIYITLSNSCFSPLFPFFLLMFYGIVLCYLVKKYPFPFFCLHSQDRSPHNNLELWRILLKICLPTQKLI